MLTLLAALALGAVDAPITNVTVFADQARVTRTAHVTINGTQTVEFPQLRDDVDPSTIRVEAGRTEVQHVEIARVEAVNVISAVPDALLTELSRLEGERTLLNERCELAKIAPQPSASEQRLNPEGWAAALAFSSDTLAATQKRLREVQQALARDAGQPETLFTPAGLKITAHLTGSGPETLTLSYIVPKARWLPTWSLQLQPETGFVTVSLAGQVTQTSGEDWSNTTLELSTAVPYRASAAPKLKSWKIGSSERFIPTPNRTARVNAVLTPRPSSTVSLTEGVTVGREFINNVPFVHPQAVGVRSFESLASLAPSVVEDRFTLSPPAAWSAHSYEVVDTASAFAGGADLTFAANQRESIPTGTGPRRVALWSQTWPVTVERKLFPALSDDAYLVAELKNPSQHVLPGGPAQLSVGSEPAGTASLSVVSPGEAFTLPLGIDRAIKTARNVSVTEVTRGLISKDEISTYTVTIEIVNPHATAITMRVFDQWPLSDTDRTEIALIDSKPRAIADARIGKLEWRLTLAAKQKQVISFVYSIKRPQGWQLSQAEQSP